MVTCLELVQTCDGRDRHEGRTGVISMQGKQRNCKYLGNPGPGGLLLLGANWEWEQLSQFVGNCWRTLGGRDGRQAPNDFVKLEK